MLRASRTLRNAFSASGLEPLAATGDAFSAETGKFLPPVFNRIVLDAAIAQPTPPLSSSSGSSSTSSSEEAQAATTTTVRARNPFIPFRNPQTGHYAPPKISLRRQADLAKIYPSEYLPTGLKNRAQKKRIGRVQTIQYEQDRLAVQWVGKVKPLRTVSSTSTKITNEALLSGPYMGRQHQPKLFKGHKHDRVRVERKEETKSRMEGMENRIAEWRKVRYGSCFFGLYVLSA
jgi:large subunit ribosomal protein L25